METVELDGDRNIAKINPLIDWTNDQVWEYIHANAVPYNALHDQNFPSIGCAPCTRAVQAGEDLRAGRWWWEMSNQECGLHVTSDGRLVRAKGE
jgi:phosphoadenosine phosphosulfate reductase